MHFRSLILLSVSEAVNSVKSGELTLCTFVPGDFMSGGVIVAVTTVVIKRSDCITFLRCLDVKPISLTHPSYYNAD